MKFYRRLLTAFAGWLILGAPFADAQTASTPSKDETIVLSPFMVKTAQDTGYAAPDTLAGTRMRSNLKDIGAPITELTRTMLDDLGASNINDLAAFLPSVALDYDVQNDLAQNSAFWDQTYRIRGLTTDTKARNYFNTLVPSDAYNLTRITLSRGANSILFGAANPAGIFNVATHEALLARDAYELQTRVDEYGTERTAFDANKVLLPKTLAMRVLLLNDKTEQWPRPLNYKDQRRIYTALAVKPFTGMAINANIENYNYSRSAPSQVIPLDRVNLWIKNGRPTRASNTVISANPAGIVNAIGANQVMGLLGSLPLGGDPAPVIVQNLLRYPVSTNSPAGVNNSLAYSLPNDFFGGDWPNFSGNDRIDASHGWVGDFTVEQRVIRNLYLQVAFHGENMTRNLTQAVNDWNLFADASTTLQDGVTPNPNVGRYFIGGSNTYWNLFFNKSRQFRATLSYEIDLTGRNKWLGQHQFAALYQIDDEIDQRERTTLRNVAPLPGFNSNILNANNQITTYIYLNPDGSYQGPSRDPRTWAETFSRNGVTARYVRSTAGTNQLTELKSALAVMQNRWWNDRIVTTAGLRNDRQDLWDADRAIWPADPVTGEFISHTRYGRKFNPLGSGVQDTTYSVGAAWHVLRRWGGVDYLSLVYNKSDNFAPSGGARGLQDELIGPSKGKTEDVGVKTGLYGGRVNVSLSAFHSGQFGAAIGQSAWAGLNPIWDALNMSSKDLDSKMTDTQDQAAKGYEAEVTLQPTRGWNIVVFASKNENRISNKWPSTKAYLNRNLPFLQDPAVSSQVTTNGQTVATLLNNYLNTYNLV